MNRERDSHMVRKAVVHLITEGSNHIRIKKEANQLTVEDLQKMNEEDGLAITYESAEEALLITRDM